MSLLIGDTGKSQIGPLKSFVITPGTGRDTLLGTALTLPTTEPATAQVSFTVQSSDLPTISPSVPMLYNAALYVSGKIGAAASVINYRVLKNGVSVAQAAGASAAATQFWAHSHWRTFDVQIGDVLEVKYWAVQADVTLDFYGLVVFPSQPDVTKRGTLLKDLTLTNILSTPNLSTVTVTNSQSFTLYPFAATNINYSNGITNLTFLATSLNTTYGLFRTSLEVFGASTTQNVNATTRPTQKQLYPSQISFREVLR